jgi:hypothetical protein
MSAQGIIHDPFIIPVVLAKPNLRSSEMAVAQEVSSPGTVNQLTKWIEPNNQDAVLFIFELCRLFMFELHRMAFPALRF